MNGVLDVPKSRSQTDPNRALAGGRVFFGHSKRASNVSQYRLSNSLPPGTRTNIARPHRDNQPSPHALCTDGLITAVDLVDVFRKHHPEGGIYSWWDYRQLAFPKGNGLRIDHVLANVPLAARSTAHMSPIL